jgi:hypothetical protein
MPKERVLLVTLAVTGVLGTLAFSSGRSVSPIDRGQYLVQALGCHDCHTPNVAGPNGWPVPDPTRLLAGHPEGVPNPTWTLADLARHNALILARPHRTAWVGPWGVSYAANLTPDRETGLGDWTEEMFLQTLRTGKHQGSPAGRDLLPPMPWANLTHATHGVPEADLKAIWAYLRSLPPIRNRVPTPGSLPRLTELLGRNGQFAYRPASSTKACADTLS